MQKPNKQKWGAFAPQTPRQGQNQRAKRKIGEKTSKKQAKKENTRKKLNENRKKQEIVMYNTLREKNKKRNIKYRRQTIVKKEYPRNNRRRHAVYIVLKLY